MLSGHTSNEIEKAAASSVGMHGTLRMIRTDGAPKAVKCAGEMILNMSHAVSVRMTLSINSLARAAFTNHCTDCLDDPYK